MELKEKGWVEEWRQQERASAERSEHAHCVWNDMVGATMMGKDADRLKLAIDTALFPQTF